MFQNTFIKFHLLTLFFIFLSISNLAHADFKNSLPDDYNYQKDDSIFNKNNSKETSIKTEKNKKQSEPKKTPSSQKSEGAFGNELTNHNANAPVYFEGNSAEGSRKTGILNLVGNVVIIQDDTKLTSNKAKIISNPGKTYASGSTSVQKAIATGNVNIYKKSSLSSPEIRASADEIEFRVPQRIMILKGKAKVWRNKEFVNADIIEINLNSGDINLKDPHGTIDPKSTTNLSRENKSSGKKNN